MRRSAPLQADRQISNRVRRGQRHVLAPGGEPRSDHADRVGAELHRVQRERRAAAPAAVHRHGRTRRRRGDLESARGRRGCGWRRARLTRCRSRPFVRHGWRRRWLRYGPSVYVLPAGFAASPVAGDFAGSAGGGALVVADDGALGGSDFAPVTMGPDGHPRPSSRRQSQPASRGSA